MTFYFCSDRIPLVTRDWNASIHHLDEDGRFSSSTPLSRNDYSKVSHRGSIQLLLSSDDPWSTASTIRLQSLSYSSSPTSFFCHLFSIFCSYETKSSDSNEEKWSALKANLFREECVTVMCDVIWTFQFQLYSVISNWANLDPDIVNGNKTDKLAWNYIFEFGVSVCDLFWLISWFLFVIVLIIFWTLIYSELCYCINFDVCQCRNFSYLLPSSEKSKHGCGATECICVADSSGFDPSLPSAKTRRLRQHCAIWPLFSHVKTFNTVSINWSNFSD